ncbi:MAG: HAD-IC family P-type ATPase [Paludibacteraceae bacterium]
MQWKNFKTNIGKGISGKINEDFYQIGNDAFISAYISTDEISVFLTIASEKGYTPLIVADDGNILGIISVADTIKPTSKESIHSFHTMGIETVMLTGDRKQTAQAMQQLSGVGSFVAEILPSEKDIEVSQRIATGKKVAMIGDGVNDAPALMRSDLGIAIGNGTDIAVESADVVLMRGDLLDAVTALKLSRYVMRIIKQNLFWAFFYNVIGIPLAAGVYYHAFGWTLKSDFCGGSNELELDNCNIKRVKNT